MKASELKRKLAAAGCTFKEGANHTIVYFQGNQSAIPRHPSKEVRTGTYRAILKQLGLGKDN